MRRCGKVVALSRGMKKLGRKRRKALGKKKVAAVGFFKGSGPALHFIFMQLLISVGEAPHSGRPASLDFAVAEREREWVPGGRAGG